MPIVKAFDIRFVKPATGDVTVTIRLGDDETRRIEGAADAAGKCDLELDAELTIDDGTVVARTHGVYQFAHAREAAGLSAPGSRFPRPAAGSGSAATDPPAQQRTRALRRWR